MARISITRDFNELRRADIFDYAEFLNVFLKAGGKISCMTLHPIHSQIYLATEDCRLPTLYGADSMEVIAARGVKVATKGHNVVFSMDEPLEAQGYVTANRVIAGILQRDHGVILQRDHFRPSLFEGQDAHENLWMLDWINGRGLPDRFANAYRENRLGWPVIRERLKNFHAALPVI